MSNYLERVKQLERQYEAVSATITEQRPTSQSSYEYNEITLSTMGCHACRCDGYISRLGISCPSCQGNTCITCGGCLRASLVWRRAQVDSLYRDVPVEELVERLQRGARWLQDQDRRYFDGDHNQALDDDLFCMMWALWSDIELALRHVHSYEGCIFGEGQHCSKDGVVFCAACNTRKKTM